MRRLSRVLAALMLVGAIVVPARAEAPSVDALLARLFAAKHRAAYELRADFNGTLTLVVAGSRLTAVAAGTFREWHQPGEPKKRKVLLRHLHLPLLLRPFSRSLRNTIEQKIETQSEDPEAFHGHDFIILEARPDSRYTLVGIRRDIVDDAIDRYAPLIDKQDPATRRAVVKWLYTSPTMRSAIVRPGPPYAFEVAVDDAGLIYELGALYNWGRVNTKITYTMADGEPVWQEVASDVVSDLSGVGRVEGRLVLNFANHCMNCR